MDLGRNIYVQVLIQYCMRLLCIDMSICEQTIFYQTTILKKVVHSTSILYCRVKKMDLYFQVPI